MPLRDKRARLGRPHPAPSYAASLIAQFADDSRLQRVELTLNREHAPGMLFVTRRRQPTFSIGLEDSDLAGNEITVARDSLAAAGLNVYTNGLRLVIDRVPPRAQRRRRKFTMIARDPNVTFRHYPDGIVDVFIDRVSRGAG